MDTAAQLADTLLPPTAASPAEQQRVIANLRQRLGMDLALYDAHGQLIGRAGHIPPIGQQQLMQKGWSFAHGGGVWILPLSDERRLVVRPQHGPLSLIHI